MTHMTEAAILRFVERLNREGVCMHGFTMMEDGQLRAKGYWAPFREGEMHRMYSVSKSVVSLAIGILIGQGKLSLEDRIATYFPEYCDDTTDARVLRLTLRDMLRMATCHSKTTYREGVDADWASTFFRITPTHEPGVMFNYDTSCSQVLASLVQKRANRPLVAFLQEQLFAPLGFEDEVQWLTDPSGVPQGGTGLMMSLRDLTKLAQCVLDGGHGLIPADYLAQALTRQIETDGRDAPEETHGYGYQFWMTRDGWAMYGMGGQMAIACPRKKLLLCCIADTRLQGGVQMLYDAFFDEIVDAPAEASTAEDKNRLKVCLEQLTCCGVPHTMNAKPMMPGCYQMQGVAGLRTVSFAEKAVTFQWDDGEEVFRWDTWGDCTTGHWSDGEPTLTSAGMTQDGALHLRVQRTKIAPSSIEVYCYPKGDTVSIRMKRSSDPMTNRYNGIAWGKKE